MRCCPRASRAQRWASCSSFAALLVPWTVCALLVNFLLPMLFAIGRSRLLNILALPFVLLHLAATAIGSALFGVDGAVGAFFVAPAFFAGVLLVVGAGRAGAPVLLAELAGDAGRFLGLAAVCFGAGWALGTALPSGFTQAALAGIVGCGLYGVGLRVLARPQLEMLVSILVVRPAPA